MPHSPVMLPPSAIRADRKRSRLPRLLHKLFFRVLRFRPTAAAESAPFGAFYGYRMMDDHCGYGGISSSWTGVLTSIPEESSEEGSPDIRPAVLRKAQSERFVAAEAAVVELEVVL